MNSKKIDIGELILQKLKEAKRPVSWLAEKICTDPSSLRKKLKKGSMNTELLRRISKALDYSFFRYYEDSAD